MDKELPLNGLVLAGGRSQRMGQDKGMMEWHGRPQRYYLADMLARHCRRVFISCRADQVAQIEADGYTALPDGSEAKAQFGAILTALRARPLAAWLVVACDLPLIDEKSLEQLITARDNGQLATAFADSDGLPEPLAAIWEPEAEAMLEQRMAEGIDCPRKSLIRSQPQVKLVRPADSAVIMNVNTPEAAAEAKRWIRNHAK